MNNPPKNNTGGNKINSNNTSKESSINNTLSVNNKLNNTTKPANNTLTPSNNSTKPTTTTLINNISKNNSSINTGNNSKIANSNLSTNSSSSINRSSIKNSETSSNKSTSVNSTSANSTNTVSQQEQGILDRLNNIISNNSSSGFINSIMGKTENAKPENNKQGNTKKGRIGDNSENVIVDTDNYIIILGVFFGLVLLVLLYFLSKTFNVGRSLERMKMFERYQKITNFNNRKGGNPKITLKDVVISSSYNSCHSGNQMLGYTSENILKQILKSGCRYIELNVFANVYGDKAKPVVSQGYKQGQWKLMLNTTNFEDCINVIAKNAFSIISKEGGSPNPNDPLFLGLNLSTGYNLACLDLMHDIIIDYLSDYLLDSKYAYQFNNYLHEIPVKNLQNKIIIFASNGFEGSNLEELVNCQWEDNTNILDNPNIDLQQNEVESFLNLDKYEKEINDKMKLEDRLTSMKKKPFTFEDSVKYSDIKKGKESAKSKLQKFHNKLQEEFGDILSKNNGKKGRNGKKGNKTKENMEDVNPLDVLSDTDNSNKTKLIRISSQVMNHPSFNASRIIQHNREGLTIVVPHVEGDWFTRNYNPNKAFELGCQFVAMNYPVIDENMDKYITKFEKFGILEK